VLISYAVLLDGNVSCLMIFKFKHALNKWNDYWMAFHVENTAIRLFFCFKTKLC